MNENGYRSKYTEKSFHHKLTAIPQAAGCKVYEQALLLYVMLTEQDIPTWVKAAIIGALGLSDLPH